MTRSRLVLLDTNVVLRLFELGIWQAVTQKYQVILAQTVIDEAQFYMRDGERHEIDWALVLASGVVDVRSAPVRDIQNFCGRFDPNYLEKLDPGEAESLTLMQGEAQASICSADKIVWRVLGNTGQAERSISLEELLQQIGLSKALPDRFSKRFREQWTRCGGTECIMGLGDRS
ncbi:MAG: type II toxin-antitoxin system VapC family toxin [Phycisphaerales bacterium]|nr:type II toxin-antitoxin system VapC family toxin [Phycisphaerales bacterium]